MNDMRAMQKKAANSDLYGFATGYIRALEAKLMDQSVLSRVFEARQSEDIVRIMQDAGYESGDAEQSLRKESHLIFELLQQIMPDQAFVEALLLFNDCHNLKVVLKYLSVWWVKPEQEAGKNYGIPESDAGLAFQGMEKMIRLPSLVEPARLFRSVRDRRSDLIPEWLYRLALKASDRFLQTYDTGRMDMLIDGEAWRQSMDIAKGLNNKFFTGYLQLKIDLINLEILLRCRSLHTGGNYLGLALLADSSIPIKNLLAAYELETEAFVLWLRKHPLMEKMSEDTILELAEGYGRTGTAAKYNRIADEIVLVWLDQARQVLRGPEIPLSYLLRRELEIKNLRIALTCLRNDISPAQARELARGKL